MFELSVFLRDRLIGRSTFNDEEVRIGRSADNEVQIDNLALSRYHASIELVGGAYLVKDWQSQNGTFVNGERIKGKRALDDGDRIGFGKFVLVFRTDTKEKEPGRDVSKKGRDHASYAIAGETIVGQVAAEVKRRPCPHVGHLEPVVTTGSPQAVPLARDVSQIGSAEGCEIRVAGAPDRAALILRGWNGYSIVPTSNAVKLRGDTLTEPQVLFSGDEIRLGNAGWRFQVTKLEVGP